MYCDEFNKKRNNKLNFLFEKLIVFLNKGTDSKKNFTSHFVFHISCLEFDTFQNGVRQWSEQLYANDSKCQKYVSF